MSYEGYTQYLCPNGHYDTVDAYDDFHYFDEESQEDVRWKCRECGEGPAWWNMVNLTNGSYYEDERIDGYVDLELERDTPTCTCECGHVHATGPAVYKIPPKGTGHHEK